MTDRADDILDPDFWLRGDAPEAKWLSERGPFTPAYDWEQKQKIAAALCALQAKNEVVSADKRWLRAIIEKAEAALRALQAENEALKQTMFLSCPSPYAVIRTSSDEVARNMAETTSGLGCGHPHLIVVGDVEYDTALTTERTAREAAENALRAIQAENDALKECLDAWHTVFGTSQLSHAQARLESAEGSITTERTAREAAEARCLALEAGQVSLAKATTEQLNRAEALEKDIESGFMKGSYARLKELQAAESQSRKLRERVDMAISCFEELKKLTDANGAMADMAVHIYCLASIKALAVSPSDTGEDGVDDCPAGPLWVSKRKP